MRQKGDKRATKGRQKGDERVIKGDKRVTKKGEVLISSSEKMSEDPIP